VLILLSLSFKKKETMKRVKQIFLLILVVGVGYAVYFLSQVFPIIAGYGAKNLCSCVFVAGRDANQVIEQELGGSLVNLGSYSVNFQDSSATGKVFGMSTRKAIYRKGLGCTLVSEVSEEELRNQKIKISDQQKLNQDTIEWPQGNKADSLLNGSAKLNAVVNEAFNETDPANPVNTRAVIVLHHGKLIAEKYANDFTAQTKLIGWSMTKTITNALVGVLVKQGKLKVDETAPVAEWKQDDRSKITLNNLLQASSGLAWEEVYAGPSTATNMLFRKKDAGAFAAQSKLEHEPNTKWYYSSGTTNIISRIVRQAVDDDYYAFPHREIFGKIGVQSMVIEPDASGTFVGSSFSYATARDWARFGQLYLNDGLWNGERIFPEGWVKYSTTPAPAAPVGEYGAQIWLNAGNKSNSNNKRFADVPNDMYLMDGFEGQCVVTVPSKNVVIVRLGLSQKREFDTNKFVSEVLGALSE
jgi:CubicO group peptidase (beta-lactamase class C family)